MQWPCLPSSQLLPPRRWWRAPAVTALGVAVVMLAACAAGPEENYRELERDPQPLEPERNPMFGTTPTRLASATSGAAVAQGAQDGLAPAVLAAVIAVQANTVVADADAEAEAPQADPQAEPEPEPRLTLHADDRRDWQPTRLTVPLGQVAHRPTYFHAPPVADRLGPVLRGPPMSRLDAALADAERKPITARRALAMPVDAVRFYLESLLLPAKAVLHPPTARELTPSGPVDRRAQQPRVWTPTDEPAADDTQDQAAEDQAAVDTSANTDGPASEPASVAPVRPEAEAEAEAD